MSNFFEKKIISGIAHGIIKPSEVALSQTVFEDSEIGMMFASAYRMEQENLPIDVDGLFNYTLKTFPQDFWLTRSSLTESANLSKSSVYQAIAEVKNSASRRFLVETVRAVADNLENIKTPQILGRLKSAISEAENLMTDTANSFVFIADLIEQQKAVYKDLYEGKFYAIPSFFQQIDDLLLDGFSKGDLHIIAGMSGNGKSALMLNFAKNQAKQGYCVAVVSLEMHETENITRLQSAETNVPRWHIRRKMHETYFDILTANLEELKSLKIAFNTITGDIYNLPFQVREMVEKHGLDILYVDYAQLYTASNHRQTKAMEIDFISKTLKAIAMENNIPVIALTQFAKSALNATVFELSDHFKESSSLKQDASTAMVISLEQTEEQKQFKDAKVIILKNRNGICFKPIELTYHGECFSFSEKYPNERSYQNYAR